MEKILIVIDMQNDFITGPLGTPEAAAIVPKVIKKVQEYAAADNRIIYTRDTHSLMGYATTQEGRILPILHGIEGTEGWQLVKNLLTTDYTIINKDSFGWRGWNTYYDFNSSRIEIIGVCTDICVVSNALILKAMFPEAIITVDASCCAGTTPERHKAALETMKSCQIYVEGDE